MPHDTGSKVLLAFAPRATRTPAEAAPPAEPDDVELLRRVAGGSSEALGAFYDRNAGLVLSVLQRMLGENGEAEEVLQEAFLQVWREARRYDPERSSPRGWLLLLARSRALDRIRAATARQRREEALGREDGGRARAVAPLGSRRLEHLDQRRRIGWALERLPPEQRRVIELAFFHGLSQTEIAAHLETPLGTIKSRALLAMKKLRAILAQEREATRPEIPTARTASPAC
jgi:RNA polymerase sigma-70 factor, ECF subfamily